MRLEKKIQIKTNTRATIIGSLETKKFKKKTALYGIFNCQAFIFPTIFIIQYNIKKYSKKLKIN